MREFAKGVPRTLLIWFSGSCRCVATERVESGQVAAVRKWCLASLDSMFFMSPRDVWLLCERPQVKI